MAKSEERRGKHAKKLKEIMTWSQEAEALQSEGASVSEIAAKMKLPESAILTLLAAPEEFKESK